MSSLITRTDERSCTMDIAELSMAMAQTNVITQASTQVLKLSMEQAETVSAELTKMMELSVNPGLGANLDVRI